MNTYSTAVALGALAGMRTNSAPAAASRLLSRHPSDELEHTPLAFMQRKGTANVFSALTIGEFIGDKIPSAPNRVKPMGLVFRCLSGAVACAAVFKASGKNAYAGAALGAAVAAGATFASFYARKKFVKKTDLYDPIVGAVEDALVAKIAEQIIRKG